MNRPDCKSTTLTLTKGTATHSWLCHSPQGS
jgi:hypothetical protein